MIELIAVSFFFLWNTWITNKRLGTVGEKLIQLASDSLVTEILIHPQLSTLKQCMRNLLASFTRHRHVVHAGYTHSGTGSWILQARPIWPVDYLGKMLRLVGFHLKLTELDWMCNAIDQIRVWDVLKSRQKPNPTGWIVWIQRFLGYPPRWRSTAPLPSIQSGHDNNGSSLQFCGSMDYRTSQPSTIH